MPLLSTVAAALIGATIFEAIRVPAGALIGSMVAVALLRVSPVSASELPKLIQFAAFVGIGWMVGQTITREVLQSLAQRAGLIVGTAILLLIFGGLIAVAAVRLGLLDPATSFLATSPGALSQMAALSASVGADTAVVVTLHLVRVVLVILLSPLILRLISSP